MLFLRVQLRLPPIGTTRHGAVVLRTAGVEVAVRDRRSEPSLPGYCSLREMEEGDEEGFTKRTTTGTLGLPMDTL
jgi:hypothetical protein